MYDAAVRELSSLTPTKATVTRVMGTLVSLRLVDRLTTVRWLAAVPVWVGREVAVWCYTDPPYLEALIVVGVEADGQRYWVDEDAMRRYARPEPVRTKLAFIPALVEAGLLDSDEIEPKLYGSTPVGVLMAHYGPKDAMDRGFLYYDHRWANDTHNPINDLASLVGRTDVRSLTVKWHELRFELGGTRHVADDLWEVAAAIDAWLEHIEAPTRLFAWDTVGDSYAFLARPLADGHALARTLGDGRLKPASTQSDYPRAGDCDYF